ncbi:MAG TPA: hypothetical protein DCR43_03305 [Bacteroidales bacterium]|nr:hypothetical protein [Bacteroidales bacterium]
MMANIWYICVLRVKAKVKVNVKVFQNIHLTYCKPVKKIIQERSRSLFDITLIKLLSLFCLIVRLF